MKFIQKVLVVLGALTITACAAMSPVSGGAIKPNKDYPSDTAPSTFAPPSPVPSAPSASIKANESAKSAGEAAPGQGIKPEAAAPPRAPAPGAQVKYLSADDSNSQASPVIVRSLIRQGQFVSPEMVRTYEFLNYADFDYKAPSQGELSLIPLMSKGEKPGEYRVQVALRSRDKTMAELGKLNFTVLLDLSGSMAGPNLDLAKSLILGILGKMKDGDLLSLVTINRTAGVPLDSHIVNKNSKSFLEKEIFPNLKANDITNLEKGIIKAYEVAEKNYTGKSVNRVIVISDGAANAGTTAPDMIAKKAQDDDRQGIYLAGIGVGRGFNDYLMNTFTDKGRGAYLFADSPGEVNRILEDKRFLSNFDLAIKNVRLKMVFPSGWSLEQFHGEQVSDKASEVVPQYLAPGDQMIYAMTIKGPAAQEDLKAQFQWEAEYTPIGKTPAKLSYEAAVKDFLIPSPLQIKGNALVDFAEALKKCQWPLETKQKENLEVWDKALAAMSTAVSELSSDKDLIEALDLMKAYRVVLDKGIQTPGARDVTDDSPDAVLGIPKENVVKTEVITPNSGGVKSLSRLLNSQRLLPQEGQKFLGISTGIVGSPNVAGGSTLSGNEFQDPAPQFQGSVPNSEGKRPVRDLVQVKLTLKAPQDAKSFSFDVNFFSAEYPGYVKQNYNDAFYALLEAPSTNGGKTTNICFDPENQSIEVDNNYFQAPFHPIPNTGTGFDSHGSTGWLRTSWPIKPGEVFTITFSVHDEGDAAYDSLAILDNFRFNKFEAAPATDPLN